MLFPGVLQPLLDACGINSEEDKNLSKYFSSDLQFKFVSTHHTSSHSQLHALPSKFICFLILHLGSLRRCDSWSTSTLAGRVPVGKRRNASPGSRIMCGWSVR